MSADANGDMSGGPVDGGMRRAQRAAPAASGLSRLQVTTQSMEVEAHPGTIFSSSGSARRSAYALAEDAIAILEHWGIKNTLFILLTFGGGERGPTVAEAEAAFNSFRSNGLAERFPGGIKVLERGDKNGRVHFHLLVDAQEDVWTGTDWDAVAKKDYRSLNPACRSAWAWICQRREKYGFGRVGQVLPIKSTGEAVARYVSTYIAKHVDQRRQEDKRARLRAYWGTARVHRRCSLRFSWAGVGGWLWRAKLAGLSKLNGVGDADEWNRRFGPRWAYHLKEYVLNFPLSFWPTAAHARTDRHGPEEREIEFVRCGPDGKYDLDYCMEFDGAVDIWVKQYPPRARLKQAMLLGKVLHWIDPTPDYYRPSWVQDVVDRSRQNFEAREPYDWVRIMKDGTVTRGTGPI
jgi:hypothetical protein